MGKGYKCLNGLIEEDDEIVDPWYLLGWLNKVRQDAEKEDLYVGNARFYLTKAKEVNVKNPTEDKEMINHIKDLLNELGPDTENDIEEEGEPEVEGEDSWEEFEEDKDTVAQTTGNGNAMEQA